MQGGGGMRAPRASDTTRLENAGGEAFGSCMGFGQPTNAGSPDSTPSHLNNVNLASIAARELASWNPGFDKLAWKIGIFQGPNMGVDGAYIRACLGCSGGICLQVI